MIRTIQGSSAPMFPIEMNAMFRARAAVFGERLGWNVSIKEGCEVDPYDAFDPLYLTCIDELTGRVCGSLRLLPTTGPNMLKDCFGPFFEEPVDIESPLIWECTRFCVHPETGGLETSATGAMRVTWELMLGICEIALRAGISQIQGVYEEPMIRVYKRTRWSPVSIARTEKLGKLPVHVGLWDVNEQTLARMQRASGITASILEPQARPLARVA